MGEDLDFSRRGTQQSRERGEENYIIQMTLWPFFHQGYGQAKLSVASLGIAWEENVVAQQSMFLKYIAERIHLPTYSLKQAEGKSSIDSLIKIFTL